MILLQRLDLLDLIHFTPRLALKICLCIGSTLLDIALNIKSVAGSFGDRETEVKCDTAGYRAKPDHNTPHPIDGLFACMITLGRLGSGVGLRLEGNRSDQCNHGGNELANSLHREDGTHHRPTPFGRSKLRGDN